MKCQFLLIKIILQVHKNLLATQKSYVVWFKGSMNMNHWQVINQTNESAQAPVMMKLTWIVFPLVFLLNGSREKLMLKIGVVVTNVK